MKALLLAVLLAAPAAASEARELSATAPAGWTSEETKSGLAFTRAPGKDGGAATIMLSFRAPAQGDPADAAGYAKSLLAPDPILGVAEGWTKGKDERVAGRTCATFERRAKALNRHAKVRPMMAERQVVVPAAGGYYVLSLYGPESAKAKDRKAFQRVLDGFKPAR